MDKTQFRFEAEKTERETGEEEKAALKNFGISSEDMIKSIEAEIESVKNLGVITKKSRFEKFIGFFSKDSSSKMFAKRCLRIVGEKNESSCKLA